MTALHAVYRCEGDHQCRWRGWLPGKGIVVGADTLDQAQRLMAAAVGPGPRLLEHTEHAAGEGLWVREALDERVPEREHVTRVLMEALHDQRLRARLAALPECLLGGVVLVACVPGDTLDWITAQLDGHGSLVVASAVTNHQVWWNALTPAAHAANLELPVAGSLAELALDDPEATLDDWIATTTCGRLATTTATSSNVATANS